MRTWSYYIRRAHAKAREVAERLRRRADRNRQYYRAQTTQWGGWIDKQNIPPRPLPPPRPPPQDE